MQSGGSSPVVTITAWDPQTVSTGVWSSVSLMTMLVPCVDSRDVVTSVTIEFAATLENVIEVKSHTTLWSRSTLPLGYNLSAQVVNWRVSLSGWSK